MDALISVSNLKKGYGRYQVLRDISFEGREGELICFTGKNGSGKSTLLSVLAGVDRPDSGRVLLRSSSVRIGYLPQVSPLLDTASVGDNLSLWCDGPAQYEAALDRFDLRQIKRKRVSRLSGGMKRRLALACVMASNPSVIIMDEPTAALDIEYKSIIHGMMKDYIAGGGLMIMVSHEAEEIGLCSRCYNISDGAITPVEII